MVATLKVDTIKEVNSSVDNLVLDSSGNVTIGNNLTVTGTTTFTGGQTFNGNLTLNTPSTTTARNINWSNGTGTVATVAGYSDSTTTGHLEFYTLQSGTTPTEQARIDQYGSLLVGTTTSPTTTTGLGTISAAGTVVMGSSFLRNRIINGAMILDQRNSGAAVTPTAPAYTLDRWQYQTNTASKITLQQSTDAPAGFTNSIKISVASAYTAGTTDYFVLQQIIEGYNTYDLSFGSASAKTVTISFWVKSSLTGTYSGCIQNGTPDRSYVYTYSISSANTWEYKTVTIPGDTTGTWNKTNGNGITLDFDLGSGSNWQNAAGSWAAANKFSNSSQANFVGTAGAIMYFSGVQFEVGSVATQFERRQYMQELVLAQRYYVGANAYYFTQGYDPAYTSLNSGGLSWSYQMRTTPSMTITGGGADGHHGTAPTLRGGVTYYGAPLQFTGSALRTNANGSAYVIMSLSAEI